MANVFPPDRLARAHAVIASSRLLESHEVAFPKLRRRATPSLPATTPLPAQAAADGALQAAIAALYCPPIAADTEIEDAEITVARLRTRLAAKDVECALRSAQMLAAATDSPDLHLPSSEQSSCGASSPLSATEDEPSAATRTAPLPTEIDGSRPITAREEGVPPVAEEGEQHTDVPSSLEGPGSCNAVNTSLNTAQLQRVSPLPITPTPSEEHVAGALPSPSSGDDEGQTVTAAHPGASHGPTQLPPLPPPIVVPVPPRGDRVPAAQLAEATGPRAPAVYGDSAVVAEIRSLLLVAPRRVVVAATASRLPGMGAYADAFAH